MDLPCNAVVICLHCEPEIITIDHQRYRRQQPLPFFAYLIGSGFAFNEKTPRFIESGKGLGEIEFILDDNGIRFELYCLNLLL